MLHLLGRREAEQTALAQLEAMPDAPPFEVAYLWGQYYEAIADYPQAQTVVERALTAARANSNRLSEIRCLAQLGLIARRRGDYAAAQDWYEQGISILNTQENPAEGEVRAITDILNNLGIVLRQQGNFEQAKTHFENALSLSHSSSNKRGEAYALDNLGTLDYHQGHFDEAIHFHRQALEILRTIGDRAREGASLLNLAMATRESGDYGQAQAYLNDALLIQNAVGNRWEEVNIWNDLGILYQELGYLSQAQSSLEQGIKIAQEIGDTVGQAYVLANLGLVARDRGDISEAEALLTKGLALAQSHNERYLESIFLNYLSTVSLLSEKYGKAITQANSALKIRKTLKLHIASADDLSTLAAAYLATPDLAASLDYVEQTLAILDECNGEGPEFPQRDYFISFQVFKAAQQEQHANAALKSAYELVMKRANKITDDELRQSFLENVAVNREIVLAYEQAQR